MEEIVSENNKNIYKIAMLVALSCILQISESLLPHPIPGLRLGLANVMTLIALVTLGFGPALEVAVLRTILSSFLMGTFMSPAFILSFSAALVSSLVMGCLYWLSSFHRRYRLSIVGISILAALTHNLVQLYLAYLILIRHKGIFVFLPWLCIGAVVMGWLTGVVAGNVCLRLKERQAEGLKDLIKINNETGPGLLQLKNYVPGQTFLHALSPEIKIIGLFIFAFLALIFNNLWLYLALFLFLIIVTLFSKTPWGFIWLKIKKSSSLVFISFLFPLIFNSGRIILFSLGNFKVTSEGATLGAIFALRILFLILASSLLVRATSPKDLARGLTKVLLPLRFLGFSQERIAVIFSLSWAAIPIFWEKARLALRSAELKKIKNLRNLVPVLSEIVASLYLETGQMSALLEEADPSLENKTVSLNENRLKKEYLLKQKLTIG